jgi:DNA oxidative demethylase
LNGPIPAPLLTLFARGPSPLKSLPTGSLRTAFAAYIGRAFGGFNPCYLALERYRAMNNFETLADGVTYHPNYYSVIAQDELMMMLRNAVAAAPLFTPEMPKTGKPFSVRMTNLGSLGWVSDRTKGYRYQATHPASGQPWPTMPQVLLDLWRDVANHQALPEACLVNFYTTSAKMGLHQDHDEQDFTAPVVSVSLGDTALFRFGGTTRGGNRSNCHLVMCSFSAAPQDCAFMGLIRSIPERQRC